MSASVHNRTSWNIIRQPCNESASVAPELHSEWNTITFISGDHKISLCCKLQLKPLLFKGQWKGPHNLHNHVHSQFISVAGLCDWMKRKWQSTQTPSPLDCTHIPCAEPSWCFVVEEEGTMGWGMVDLTPMRKVTFSLHLFHILLGLFMLSLHSLWDTLNIQCDVEQLGNGT